MNAINNCESLKKRSRKIKCEWSSHNILQIISFVESRRELWDYSHSDYKNRNIRMKLLEEISSAMEKEVEDVGTKWQNLRSQYNAERRKLFKTKSGQGAEDSRTKWEYFAALNFLSVQTDECMSQSTLSVYNMEIKGGEIMVTECSAAFGGAFI